MFRKSSMRIHLLRSCAGFRLPDLDPIPTVHVGDFSEEKPTRQDVTMRGILPSFHVEWL